MVKDFFVSFRDNIKGKVTNPFFGTLIAVWLIHNYKFVYTIFNFRTSTGLDDRLTFIGTYLERDNFLPDLGWCILYALGALLLTYILLNVSRVIVLWFERRITPHINKFVDSKLIVTIDVHNSQVAETKKFEKRYKDEQEAKLDLQNKYDELEKKLQSQLRLQEAREDFKEPYVEDETEDIKESESSVVEAFPKSQQARVEETIRDVKATTSGIDTAKLKALLQDEDLIQLFNEASLDVIKEVSSG